MNTKKRYKMVVPSEHEKFCNAAQRKIQDFLTGVKWTFCPKYPSRRESILNSIIEGKTLSLNPDLLKIAKARMMDETSIDRFEIPIEELFVPPSGYEEEMKRSEEGIRDFGKAQKLAEADAHLLYKSVESGEISTMTDLIKELYKIATLRFKRWGFPSRQYKI